MTLRDLASARLRVSRRGVLKAIGAVSIWEAAKFTGHLAVSEAVVKGAEEVAAELPWWKQRAEPLKRPMEMYRGSERQRRAAILLARGMDLDDDILSRTTVTYTRKGKRWMEKQGERISIWPGWSATDIPMEDQPDEVFGRWAARELDAAAYIGEPILDRVGAAVKQSDGTFKDLVYTRLLVPTKNAVYSVTELG